MSTGHRSHWDEIPGYPVSDWQMEVASDDTRLGYLDWADAGMQLDKDFTMKLLYDVDSLCVTQPGEDVVAATARFMELDTSERREYPPITQAITINATLWAMAAGCWVIAVGSLLYWWLA